MQMCSEKRRSCIAPIKIPSQTEDKGKLDVPSLSFHMPMIMLTMEDDESEIKPSCSPQIVLHTPPPHDGANYIPDELLATSPARSDASSSMKSRESALERRVSLLLRNESPAVPGGATLSRSSTPQQIHEYAPCALPAPVEELEEELLGTNSNLDFPPDPRPPHKRLSSLAPKHFFSPKPHLARLSKSPGEPKTKAKKLTKRMSPAVSRSTTPKYAPRRLNEPSPVSSTKSSPSIRESIDRGLKALTRARSTLVRKTSPLLHSVSRQKSKLNLGVFRDKVIEHGTGSERGLSGFANSPASTDYGNPSSIEQHEAPVLAQCPPLRPQSVERQIFSRPCSHCLAVSATPVYSDTLSPLAQHPVNLCSDLDELAKRGTTRLRLAPSDRQNGRRRLSVTDASTPGLLDSLARRSIDSVHSGVPSSIGSQALDHELRRTTTRIKRGTLLAELRHESDSMTSSKRPRSTGRLLSARRPHDDVFVDTPQPSPSIAPSTVVKDSGARRGVLKEMDPNSKVSCDDIASVKTAQALKMSITPKVKEVFNKFPMRRQSFNKPPKSQHKVSRSSSKASRVLGHHFSSKEPLRPASNINSNIAQDGLREETLSEDELAL